MPIRSCSSGTSFYRIITPSVFDESQLSIPDEFVESDGNRLSAVVRLTVHTGDEWCVSLKKVGKAVLFSDGWKEFMEHYSIGIGYFLLFICRKNCSFDVHVFDKTATELWHLPRTNDSAERSIHVSRDVHSEKGKCIGVSDGRSLEVRRSYRTRSKVKMIGEEGSISDAEQVLGDGHSNKPLLAKSLMGDEGRDSDYSATWIMENANDQREAIMWSKGDPVDDDGKSYTADRSSPIISNCKIDREELDIKQEKEGGSVVSKESSKYIIGRKATAQEIIRASREAKMFAPNNPYFIVSLQEYNVKKSFSLCIPAKFVKENLPNIPKNIEIQDSDGYSWEVKSCLSGKHCVVVSRGWATFVREKKLVAGDACGFELIKDLQDDNVVFKVHIFRVMVENANR